MGESVAIVEKLRNDYKILVCKPERKTARQT
jgi:hypothetical protein